MIGLGLSTPTVPCQDEVDHRQRCIWPTNVNGAFWDGASVNGACFWWEHRQRCLYYALQLSRHIGVWLVLRVYLGVGDSEINLNHIYLFPEISSFRWFISSIFQFFIEFEWPLSHQSAQNSTIDSQLLLDKHVHSTKYAQHNYFYLLSQLHVLQLYSSLWWFIQSDLTSTQRTFL